MDNDKVIGLTEQIEELKKTSDYLLRLKKKHQKFQQEKLQLNSNSDGNPVDPKITLGSALGKIYIINKIFRR